MHFPNLCGKLLNSFECCTAVFVSALECNSDIVRELKKKNNNKLQSEFLQTPRVPSVHMNGKGQSSCMPEEKDSF